MRSVCSKCGIEKDLEEFKKRKESKSGRSSCCKQCHNNKNKEYRDKDIEKYNEKMRNYLSEWRVKNPEKRKKQVERDKENQSKRSKKWYQENRSKKNNYSNRWAKENKDKRRVYEQKGYKKRNTKKKEERSKLDAWYIKQTLKQQGFIETTPELIETKAEIIKIKRLIKCKTSQI